MPPLRLFADAVFRYFSLFDAIISLFIVAAYAPLMLSPLMLQRWRMLIRRAIDAAAALLMHLPAAFF